VTPKPLLPKGVGGCFGDEEKGMGASTREQRQSWIARNKKRILAWQADYNKRNPDKRAEWNRRWKQKNKGNGNAHKAKRKALILQATPKWADLKAIEAIYVEAMRRSQKTGKKYSVDHIVPLRSPLVCGLHCEANLRVMLLSENCKRANRYWPDMP
jgi:hypothetical protein